MGRFAPCERNLSSGQTPARGFRVEAEGGDLVCGAAAHARPLLGRHAVFPVGFGQRGAPLRGQDAGAGVVAQFGGQNERRFARLVLAVDVQAEAAERGDQCVGGQAVVGHDADHQRRVACVRGERNN